MDPEEVDAMKEIKELEANTEGGPSGESAELPEEIHLGEGIHIEEQHIAADESADTDVNITEEHTEIQNVSHESAELVSVSQEDAEPMDIGEHTELIEATAENPQTVSEENAETTDVSEVDQIEKSLEEAGAHGTSDDLASEANDIKKDTSDYGTESLLATLTGSDQMETTADVPEEKANELSEVIDSKNVTEEDNKDLTDSNDPQLAKLETSETPESGHESLEGKHEDTLDSLKESKVVAPEQKIEEEEQITEQRGSSMPSLTEVTECALPSEAVPEVTDHSSLPKETGNNSEPVEAVPEPTTDLLKKATAGLLEGPGEGLPELEEKDFAPALGEDDQTAAALASLPVHDSTEENKNDETITLEGVQPLQPLSMPLLTSLSDQPVLQQVTKIDNRAQQDLLQDVLKTMLQGEGQQQIVQSPRPVQTQSIFIGTLPKQAEQPVISKKEETDDLATLANAALGDQAANGVKFDDQSKKEPLWCDVGVIKGTSCNVTSYYEPGFDYDPEHETISSDNLPDYSASFKVDLEPGTAYKFRICAINSCGRGPWSEVSAFKTCLPGYPGAPSSIKISKSNEGAHLSWEPPSNPAGNIIEYSVCLAVRNPPPSGAADQKGQQLAFVRVYSGPHNQTVVPNSSLAAAHIDTTSKPAIIFRIAAKNEKGFGPATQVRWLQDVVASPTGNVKPLGKKEAVPSGIPTKRGRLDDY